jgi:hypothetical protein
MSGPVTPPLEVTEVDGSPDGRPITKLIVSNGDLTVSGRTATIDTSGSTSTPGGSDTEVQYNNAGAFGGDSDFTFTGIGGASPAFTITNSASDAGIYTSTRITLDGGTELSVLTTTDGDDGLLLATGTDGLAGPFIVLDVVTDPSNLLIKNAEENGTINIQTDSGSGDITLTTVGDLRLIASQTLAFTAATTASVTSTTTNNDMNFNIIADGAGTPLINLKNDTKEVRLTCEDDDKLYVRGPTSGERFTFDASSATGGITWPDGSTQISAASGGGNTTTGFSYTGIKTGSHTYWDLSAYPSGMRTQTQVNATESQSGPVYVPFVAGDDVTITNLAYNIATVGNAGLTYEVAIYSTGTDGLPDTKLVYATLVADATGTQSATITEVVSGDADLTRGTQYSYAYTQTANASTNPIIVSAPTQYIGAYADSNVYTAKVAIRGGTLGTLPTTAPTTWIAIGVDAVILGAQFT